MTDPIRPEVIRRFVLAKALHREGKFAVARRSDQFEFARGLLLLHDSSESALGAIADHVNARLSGNHYLLDYYKLIEEADPMSRAVPYRVQMRNLNSIRNHLKHQGIFPGREGARHFPNTVEALLEELSTAYLGVELRSLSLIDLIKNENARNYIRLAEANLSASQCEQALVHLAYAIYHLVEFSSIRGLGLPTGSPDDSPRYDFTEPYGTDYTVTLLQHGVDPYTYHRFRNLTPRIAQNRSSGEITYHWDKIFGHPANWTEKNVTFCLDFASDTALKVQHREPYDYEIVYYPEVYEDVITPSGDSARIWSAPARSKVGIDRQLLAELQKGQQLVGIVYDQVEDPDELQIVSAQIPARPILGAFVASGEVTVTRRQRRPSTTESEGAAE